MLICDVTLLEQTNDKRKC